MDASLVISGNESPCCGLVSLLDASLVTCGHPCQSLLVVASSFLDCFSWHLYTPLSFQKVTFGISECHSLGLVLHLRFFLPCWRLVLSLDASLVSGRHPCHLRRLLAATHVGVILSRWHSSKNLSYQLKDACSVHDTLAGICDFMFWLVFLALACAWLLRRPSAF